MISILLIILLFSSCTKDYEIGYVELKPIESCILIERAMFTSNNGFSRELNFQFTDSATKKDKIILALVKDTTVLFMQDTGKLIDVGDIKPGTFCALYFNKADFAESIPKKAIAVRIVVLAMQDIPVKLEPLAGLTLVQNATISYIENNTIMLTLDPNDLAKRIKLYINCQTDIFDAKNGVRISIIALKKGQKCSFYIKETQSLPEKTNVIRLLIER